MSLSSYITGKPHQGIRDLFKNDFPKPTFVRPHPELKAKALTKNYGLIGTAFDYLFRFHLEFHNKGKVLCRDRWVADTVIETLALRLKLSLKYRHSERSSFEAIRNALAKYRLVRDQYLQAKIDHLKFLDDGILTDDLIIDALFLAKMDVVLRAGLVAQLFEEHELADIIDLKRVIGLVDFKQFVAKEHCYLNPTFGVGSQLVGGADCDVIIDDALIEIKVTKDYQLRREHFNQLIGYYVLSLIGGLNDKPRTRPIKKIGIYFARHGVLWIAPLTEFGNREKYVAVKDWLVGYINQRKEDRRKRIQEFLESRRFAQRANRSRSNMRRSRKSMTASRSGEK